MTTMWNLDVPRTETSVSLPFAVVQDDVTLLELYEGAHACFDGDDDAYAEEALAELDPDVPLVA